MGIVAGAGLAGAAAPAGLVAGAAAGLAAAAAGAGAPGTFTRALHLGHLTFLPAAVSGARNVVLHWEQVTVIGMVDTQG